MGFKYNSADASTAWPDGQYDAVILAVEETTSKKSGADMLKLTLETYSPGGKKQTIFDYIVNPTGLFKLKQLAGAFDRAAEFNANTFDLTKYQNRRVTVELNTQKQDGYDDKNGVKKYSAAIAPAGTPKPVKRESVGAGAATPLSDEKQFKDEDIPF